MDRPEVYIAMSVEDAKGLFSLLATGAHAGLHEQHLTPEETLAFLQAAATMAEVITAAEKGGGFDPRMN